MIPWDANKLYWLIQPWNQHHEVVVYFMEKSKVFSISSNILKQS